MSREHIFHKVRTALGRTSGQTPSAAPLPRLCVPELEMGRRLEIFSASLDKLAGKTCDAASRDEACAYAAALIGDRRAVASNAPLLESCGITRLAGVESGFTEREPLIAACREARVGITGADYALADTGSLVLFSSFEEARVISLLPPVHLAFVSRGRLLTGLDELLTLLPHPSERSSSMIIITGPSRTADIEQILVRGVHGPGEIHVVVV